VGIRNTKFKISRINKHTPLIPSVEGRSNNTTSILETRTSSASLCHAAE
jgi:hypothetical protein